MAIGWIFFSRAVAAERGKDGKVTRIVGTHVDISELKKTQENLAIALNESEKKQKEISELLKATHAILSTTDFEEAARKIFEACKLSIGAKAGYIALLDETEQQNELLFLDDGGLPCTVDPNLPMPVRGLREEAYKTGKVVYNNNFMNSKWAKFMPKGHVNLPNVLFAPLIIHDKAVGVLGLSNKDTDFTEDDANLAFAFAEYAAIALLNSQAREKLEIRAKELQESNAMKDKLFSVIGHDLKNPLNNIINVTEAMHKGFGEMPENLKEKSTYLLKNAATTAAKLLEDLLTWSRSQTRSLKLNPGNFGLYQSVQNCFEITEGAAKAKGIVLSNKVLKSEKIYADEKMVSTIFRNLVSNAIKFTQKGGKVEVLSLSNHEVVTIEIKDNGIGMDKSKLAKLFHIDEKHSSRGTEGERGTGLGLLICKDFVEQNNGKIWAKSEPGKGSSFFISFPKKQNDAS
jgi:signal transduction histidine kinase